MTSDLAVDALNNALALRGAVGAIVHSDRGSQGGFKRSSQHLERGGTRGQTGRVDEGVDGEVGDEVAGSPVLAPGRGAGVLA
jgi:putative transposase